MKPRPIMLLPLCCVLLAATTQAADERQLIRKAIKASREGNHEEALRLLEPAGAEHPAETAYNRGRSLYRLERFDEAAQAFDEAARTPNLELQQHALYNRGNALLGAIMQTPKEVAPKLLNQAIQKAETAVECYEQALNLKPDDAVAQNALKFARKTVDELKKLKEEQEKQQQQQNQEQEQQQESQPDQQQSQPPESDEGTSPDQTNPSDRPDPPEEAAQPEAPQPEKRAEELTPEEAERLLDAMKRNEQNQRPSVIYGRTVEVEKNW